MLSTATLTTVPQNAPVSAGPAENAEAAAVRRMIQPLDVNAFRGDVRLRGQRPTVRVLASAAADGCVLDVELAALFEAQYNEFLRLAGGNARSLSFGFEVSVSGGYVNVRFMCTRTAVTAEEYIFTTVINAAERKVVRLTDVIGGGGVYLINRSLSARISANPTRFSVSFAGVTDAQCFYVDGETVVLTFNEFELIAARVGITEVRVDRDDITNAVFYDDGMFLRNGVVMIRLRTVADTFGFGLVWTEGAGSVVITDGGRGLTVVIGDVRYGDTRRLGAATLEAPPELYNGRTYLPLSFYSELGLAHYVTADGTVIFTRYSGVLAITP
jgi:hypothetical protein